MANVNFECGNCHNLMAVSEEYLGQQVRCPTCQQVVLAPVPPPSPSEVPSFEVSGDPERDSIFAPPQSVGDGLFDDEPPPRIEIPTHIGFPSLGLDQPAPPTDGPSAPPVAPQPDRLTVTYTGPEPPAPGADLLSPDGPAAAPAPQEAPAPDGEPLVKVESRVRPSRGGGWVTAIVLVPLISYSILATIAIIILLSERRGATHPLEMVPDLEGDHKGGAQRGGGKRGSVEFRLPNPDQPVPPQLRVPLADPPRSLAVGDLEVTPQKVERGRPQWAIGPTLQSFPEDALILRLKLRNVSRDVTFYPMDRYFERAWPKMPGDHKPYTLLEMGERKFYGGPLDWSHKEEFLKGQDVNKELKPGEEMATFVCTNPEEHVVRALDGYAGPLVWHVQLRRGLVRWTTRDGAERDDSATAVVGVEFSAADVKAAD
jgi:hypothetical protein